MPPPLHDFVFSRSLKPTFIFSGHDFRTHSFAQILSSDLGFLGFRTAGSPKFPDPRFHPVFTGLLDDDFLRVRKTISSGVHVVSRSTTTISSGESFGVSSRVSRWGFHINSSSIGHIHTSTPRFFSDRSIN